MTVIPAGSLLLLWRSHPRDIGSRGRILLLVIMLRRQLTQRRQIGIGRQLGDVSSCWSASEVQSRSPGSAGSLGTLRLFADHASLDLDPSPGTSEGMMSAASVACSV